MQLWQYCLLVTAILLYMIRTLSASIIRSTKNCSSSHWCMSWVGMIYIQQGRPRSVATALCHSLVRTLAVTNKKYCQSCILLVLYIIETYDARKLKYKRQSIIESLLSIRKMFTEMVNFYCDFLSSYLQLIFLMSCGV